MATAKTTYKLKRVKGEFFNYPGGIPLWSVEERKGSRVIRRWHGTQAEMVSLAKQARAANRRNPSNWKSGKWIKASAVRVRKVAGRLVMDIKKAI